MTGAAEMSAAPRSFVVGGIKLEIEPIRIRDLGRIEQWARGVIIGAAVEGAKRAGLDKYERQEVLNQAIDLAARVGFQPSDDEAKSKFENLLVSIEGNMQLVWAAVRRSAPEHWTVETLEEMIEAAKIPEIAAQVIKESGLDESQEGGAQPGAKKSE